MKAARLAVTLVSIALAFGMSSHPVSVYAQLPEYRDVLLRGSEFGSHEPPLQQPRTPSNASVPRGPRAMAQSENSDHFEPSEAAGEPPVAARAEAPKVSGYLFSAETGQAVANTVVQLCGDEACRDGISAVTDGSGYYEFVFHSLLQVVTDTQQIAGYYTPGEIHVAPVGGDYSAIFSVYYNGEDYRSSRNKHQLAYIYPNRRSWGWSHSTAGLHQYFVLHPPADLPLPSAIEPDETPLLLVHGHAGKDSTWLGLRPSLEARGYQTWEVYYPGRDHIVEGAAALQDAVRTILELYLGNQVDMVTHSMGGSVSRSYVAGTARHPWDSGRTPLVPYEQRVRKLLQLAPASSGVLNILRLADPFWQNYCAAVLEVFEAFGFHDPKEPALQDLAFASPLYVELESRPAPMPADDFLIVAGTKAFLRLCPEARNQTDLVIGNSSSSLLDQGVPLGLVYRDHSEMVGQMNAAYRLLWGPTPQPVFDDDSDPYNDALQLVDLIDGFLRGDLQAVRQNLDVHIDPGRNPDSPRTWEVTVVDRSISPPQLETRTDWPASQWNDGRNDTAFDAGGLWLRIESRHSVAADTIRICDAVQSACWRLRQTTETGLWILDDTQLGFVLPSSEFGYPYTVTVERGAAQIDLGKIEIKPLQVVSTTLSLDFSQIYLPTLPKARP